MAVKSQAAVSCLVKLIVPASALLIKQPHRFVVYGDTGILRLAAQKSWQAAGLLPSRCARAIEFSRQEGFSEKEKKPVAGVRRRNASAEVDSMRVDAWLPVAIQKDCSLPAPHPVIRRA